MNNKDLIFIIKFYFYFTEDKPEKQYLAIKFKYVKDKKNKNKPTVEKIMLGIETYYKDSNKDGIEEIEWSEMAPYLE